LRGEVDHIFAYLQVSNYHREVAESSDPSVLNFIDYKQAFDSAGSRALVKVLSYYGILDKYIKVICAMYENNIAAVKVGNEDRSCFPIESGVKQVFFFYPH